MNDTGTLSSGETLNGITETHFCVKCNQIQPFYVQKNRRKGNCKICANNRRQSFCKCGSTKDIRAKLCRECLDKQKSDPLCSQCHTKPKVTGRRWNLCKECRRQKCGVKDFENRMNWELKTKYKITLSQMEQMFISQNGRCAICLKDFENTKNMHVDHNHATGQVRQLLCNKCNSAIGYLNENVSVLARAIDYLNRWNSK